MHPGAEQTAELLAAGVADHRSEDAGSVGGQLRVPMLATRQASDARAAISAERYVVRRFEQPSAQERLRRGADDTR
jgi:hypothetical protein